LSRHHKPTTTNNHQHKTMKFVLLSFILACFMFQTVWGSSSQCLCQCGSSLNQTQVDSCSASCTTTQCGANCGGSVLASCLSSTPRFHIRMLVIIVCLFLPLLFATPTYRWAGEFQFITGQGIFQCNPQTCCCVNGTLTIGQSLCSSFSRTLTILNSKSDINHNHQRRYHFEPQRQYHWT